jgi:hypothetical protein
MKNMLIRDLLEAPERTEREVNTELRRIEPTLDHAARYKEFEIDMQTRTVYWVTQEMEDRNDLARTAKDIAGKLLKARFGFWSVYICLRDNLRGYNDSTDWVKYVPLQTE